MIHAVANLAAPEGVRFRSAIMLAIKENEPDNLYFEFDRQLQDALANGAISVGEWSSLSAYLDIHWWEGHGDLDRDYKGEC